MSTSTTPLLPDPSSLDTTQQITPPPYVPPATGFRGLLQRLPKAFAVVAANHGRPAALQSIEEDERRQDMLRQQAFANTITAQRENRNNQLFAPQLKNFNLELQKRQFDFQQDQVKAQREQATQALVPLAAQTPPEMLNEHGMPDPHKIAAVGGPHAGEIAQRLLQVQSGKEFQPPHTMTLQDGSVAQWDQATNAWKPAMMQTPNPAFQARAADVQTNPPLVNLSSGAGFQRPQPTLQLPMTAAPKATNVKELLQAQIAQAAQAGDKKKVAQLQQRLKDIDPTGEERIRLAEANAGRAQSKFDVDYPLDQEGNRQKPTSQTRTRSETAKLIAPHIDEIRNQIRGLAKQGKFGPLAGRWEEFTVGKFGAKDKDYAAFRPNAQLLQSAIAMMHGGARAAGSPEMLKYIKDTVKLMSTDPDNAEAVLDSIKGWVDNYAAGPGGIFNNRQGPRRKAAGKGNVLVEGEDF